MKMVKVRDCLDCANLCHGHGGLRMAGMALMWRCCATNMPRRIDNIAFPDWCPLPDMPEPRIEPDGWGVWPWPTP